MFITHYLNLCEPVVEALKRQGHEVAVIQGYSDGDDPRMLDHRIKISEKRIDSWKRRLDAFWKRHEEVIAKGYDLFISLNGTSINGTAFELIEKYSPGIEKVMFTWDSFNFYDYRQIEQYFDRPYTFDIVDAETSGWNLLPPFYVKKDVEKAEGRNDYDVFMIGTNHDMRYTFIRKIMPVLKSNGLTYYIKIMSPRLHWKSINFAVDCVKSLYIPGYYAETLFTYGYVDKELMIHEAVGLDKYTDIMSRSKCILDDNRPLQAGLSLRFIRALALGKKLITTNQWAHQFSFVDKDTVMIVDKKKPVIDVDFIRKPSKPILNKDFEALEVSNWVKILTGEMKCPKFKR